jgi:dihydroorotate dehydrogenase electron transfer subunit
MMREVARICAQHGIDSCQLALERGMACGLGVCMGCVVKVRADAGRHSERSEKPGTQRSETGADSQQWRYSRICTDGPVYEARELVWE